MAVFQDDNLKPEESLGGFEPNAPDDESFQAQDLDSYPGVMPEFDNDETIVLSEPEPESQDAGNVEIDAEANEMGEAEFNQDAQPVEDVSGEGSVWDLFEENPAEQTASEPVAVEETTEEVADDFANQTVEAAEPEAAMPEEMEAEPALEQNEEDQQAIDEIEIPIDEEEAPAPVVEPEVEESSLDEEEDMEDEVESIEEEKPVTIDDELKSLLQEELDRGKSSKAAKTGEKASSGKDYDVNEVFADFDDVGKNPNIKSIELANIEAEHPSTFGLEGYSEEEQQQKSDDNMAMDNQEQEPSVTDEKEEKNKKTGASKFPIKKIGLIASIVLIVLLVVTSAYIYRHNISGFISSKDSVSTNAITAVVDSSAEQKKDSIVEPAPVTETSTTISKTVQPVVTEKIENKVEKVKEKKEITPAKTIKPAVKQVVKKKNIKKNRSVAKHKTGQSRPISSKEIYTVQVYASPSLDDANEWLAKLKKKNIGNAFITPHKVRDRVMYRVRFGKFSSQADAKAAALKLGFAQSWIDRIK